MTLIGLEDPADIIMPAPQVSARHAEIVAVGRDAHEPTHGGSTNGVFPSGVRTSWGKIGPTDVVRRGSYVLDLRPILAMVGRLPAGSALYSVLAAEPVSLPGTGASGYLFVASSVPLLYAGLWLRFAASVLCFVLLRATPPLGAPGMAPFGLVVGILAGWLYYLLFESSEQQATPGKVALGMQVPDPGAGACRSGGPPG